MLSRQRFVACAITASAASALVIATGFGADEGMTTCPDALHASFAARAPDGSRQLGWHPAVDTGSGCSFGHEHGSDPSKFIGAGKVGAPTFGWLATRMGMSEPNAGFKVFVINDDGRGKAWMGVVHQGTGSPRRSGQAHHTVDLWMVRRRDGALLAEVHVMADFGAAVRDCDEQDPPSAARVLPALGPGCSQDYESWTTQLSVGGKLKALGISFGVDNPTTVIDPADPTKTTFNTPAVCGVADPAGPDSTCKGDRRWIQHPRWVLNNRGPSVFYTDAYGGRASSKPFPGSVRQFVRSGVKIDERRNWGGPSVEFKLADPRTGVFKPSLPGKSRGFDTQGAVRWPN